MVDVSAKAATKRQAEASAFVAMAPRVVKALPANPKGNPLEIARIAGISAAKRTAELIPMCHPLPLTHIDVRAELCENGVAIASKVTTTAATGVEMEALVAASVAALTVYDMCKALDKGIEIRHVVLERKSGGKSGDYRRRIPESNRDLVRGTPVARGVGRPGRAPLSRRAFGADAAPRGPGRAGLPGPAWAPSAPARIRTSLSRSDTYA